MLSSDAGKPWLRRRRDFSFSSSTSLTKTLPWPLFWLRIWPLPQSSRTFTLLLDFDEALTSNHRGRRGYPAVYHLSSPLAISLISESTQEEPFLSRSVVFIKFEIYFIVLLNLSTSGSASISLDAYNHWNSWTATHLPPPAHQINHLWLRFELSEICWRLEFLGLSLHAPPPVKSWPPHTKTLIWLEVPLIGLGPEHQQQPLSPTSNSLKTISKSCGQTSKSLKPSCMLIIEAQLLLVSRSVYLLLMSSPITLMLLYIATHGRRLQVRRIATSLGWLDSLLKNLDLGLNLLKTSNNTQPSRTIYDSYQQIFDWYAKASQEESTHRISSTAGENPGPLRASFPVMVSRMHDNLFFWVTVSVIEYPSKFGSYNLPTCFFSLMLCISMDRSLCSYPDATSLIRLCEYLYQTLTQNSSTTIFEVFLTLCLMPVRLKFMELSSTSQCLLIRTIHHYSDLIVIMASTYIDLACDLVLHCSCLRFLWIMMSKYLPLVLLSHYAFRLVVPSFDLDKTLSSVIFSSC